MESHIHVCIRMITEIKCMLSHNSHNSIVQTGPFTICSSNITSSRLLQFLWWPNSALIVRLIPINIYILIYRTVPSMEWQVDEADVAIYPVQLDSAEATIDDTRPEPPSPIAESSRRRASKRWCGCFSGLPALPNSNVPRNREGDAAEKNQPRWQPRFHLQPAVQAIIRDLLAVHCSSQSKSL